MPTLFSNPIETLTFEDVLSVIGWPESLTVEYKEALPRKRILIEPTPDDVIIDDYVKNKLFKEIVALANTLGGHLVVGVAENRTDKLHAASAIKSLPRCVDVAERLARAAQSIDPPIPLLLVKGIPVDEDRGVVLFRVPASRSAPHRNTDRECYVRRGTESVPMSMREIQDMTLASGRREEALDVRFRRAAVSFLEWFATGQDSIKGVAGFRITASPTIAQFDLGRVYGRDELLCRVGEYVVAIDTTRVRVTTLRQPDRARSILRGARWTSYDESDSPSPVYVDLYSDGTVNLGFRFTPLSPPLVVHIGWVMAHAINVLRTACLLRNAGGVPDAEYGIEVEFSAWPGRESQLLGWNGQIGRILTKLPLVLPRLSFGPLQEVNQVVSTIINDACDAAAGNLTRPLSFSVDLSTTS